MPWKRLNRNGTRPTAATSSFETNGDGICRRVVRQHRNQLTGIDGRIVPPPTRCRSSDPPVKWGHQGEALQAGISIPSGSR